MRDSCCLDVIGSRVILSRFFAAPGSCKLNQLRLRSLVETEVDASSSPSRLRSLSSPGQEERAISRLTAPWTMASPTRTASALRTRCIWAHIQNRQPMFKLIYSVCLNHDMANLSLSPHNEASVNFRLCLVTTGPLSRRRTPSRCSVAHAVRHGCLGVSRGSAGGGFSET